MAGSFQYAIGILLAFHVISIHAATPLRSEPHDYPWAWACRNGRGCVKVDKVSPPGDDEPRSTLAACKLTCNPAGSLWPKPREISHLSKAVVGFQPNAIKLERVSTPTAQVTELVTEAFGIFTEVTHRGVAARESKSKAVSESQVKIQVNIVSDETRLKTETNESYTLYITTGMDSEAGPQESPTTTTVVITATTFFGARHGLETLSQLISWDDIAGHMIMITEATIFDYPAFPHRGLLIDTSRNYVTVPIIKKIIDAMAYDKLNVFHWHITDSHSFPFVSRRQPEMSLYGAYSPSKVYTPEDIEVLVHYATVRGVKIVPEFDAPSHIGMGWEWTKDKGLGDLALCVNKEPWTKYCVEPPCGILNPVNDHVYPILNNIYKDMSELFQSDIFHMGGDEVKMDCWNETEEILTWLKARGFAHRSNDGFLHLWSHFQNRSLEELDNAYGNKQPVVLWTSGLTEEGHTDRFLDKNRYIIQIWTTGTDKSIAELYQQGFRLIMSNYDAWYFDCGYGQWVGQGPNNWCSPYIGWQKVYENSPRKLIQNFNLTFSSNQVWGGEAALWTEQVDSATMEGKLWPRASALAERLWTDPDSGWYDAEPRMVNHRQRLVQRGIFADAVQPEWCHQFDGYCFL